MNEQKQSTVKIVALCGSLREKSYTRMALKIALEGAAEYNTETQLIDLRQFKIPFCDDSKENYNAPDVLKISKLIKESDGVIIGSPEYHGSYTGVLKNLLDLLGFEEFQGKMIGLVGIAGGSLGATNTLNGLRTIGRQLHGWVLPGQVSIPRASGAFNEFGRLNDEKLETRLKDVGKEVAKFAFLHSSQEAQQFLETWEKAPSNPGGTSDPVE